MDPNRYLAALRRRWDVIAALAVLGVLAAALVTLFATPQYRSSTTVFFALQGARTAQEQVAGSNFTVDQARSFAEVATQPAVLDPVIRDLGLDTTPARLARLLEVEARLDTALVDIAATDPSPQRAAEIADAVAIQLSRSVSELTAGSQGDRSLVVRPVAPAAVPEEASSPNPRRNLAAGLLLGLALGVAVAVARELLDTRVRDERSAEELTGAPVLGAVPLGLGKRPLSYASQDLRAEAFRTLRTNLLSARSPDGPRSVVVTSALPGEGRTTTAIDLGLVAAHAGLRVLLVDADLRDPSVERLLELDERPGLTDLLLRQVRFAEAVHALPEGLHVLSAGTPQPAPSELLGGEAMGKLLAGLTERYDLLVLDGSPLLPVTDAAVLAKQADGALLVLDAMTTRREDLEQAVRLLGTARAAVLGLVVNKVSPGRGLKAMLTERRSAWVRSARSVRPGRRGRAAAGSRRGQTRRHEAPRS